MQNTTVNNNNASGNNSNGNNSNSNNSTVTKVYLRFPHERHHEQQQPSPIAVKKDSNINDDSKGHITKVSKPSVIPDSHDGEAVWDAEKLKELQRILQFLKVVDNGDGGGNVKISIDYDFSLIVESFGVEKRIIYGKLIELYHSEKVTGGANDGVEKMTVNRNDDGVDVESSMRVNNDEGGRLVNAGALANSSSLKQSLLDKLELLKLGNSGGSGSGGSGGGSGNLGVNGIGGLLNSYSSQSSDADNQGDGETTSDYYEDEDDESDEGEDDGGSMINITAESMYLHRSKILKPTKGHGGNKKLLSPSTRRHYQKYYNTRGRPEKEAGEGDRAGKDELLALDEDRYLLTGTSNSLSNSLLEKEVLKRI